MTPLKFSDCSAKGVFAESELYLFNEHIPKALSELRKEWHKKERNIKQLNRQIKQIAIKLPFKALHSLIINCDDIEIPSENQIEFNILDRTYL